MNTEKLNRELVEVDGYSYHLDCLTYNHTDHKAGKLNVTIWDHRPKEGLDGVCISTVDLKLPTEVLRGLALTILAEVGEGN